MLLENSQKSLADLLMAAADCEKSVENSRQDLCSHPKFSVHTAFALIDTDGNGKVTNSDLKAFVSKRSMAITKLFLDQLIFQYDFNKDSKLSLVEFQALVCPAEADLTKGVSRASPSLYLESLLARHIELESTWQGQLQTYKRHLFTKNDFSAIGAFRALYPNIDAFIDPVAIRDFLRKFHKDVGLAECERIVRRLDKDRDGLVNYEDFVQFVLPVDKKLEIRKKKGVTRAQTRTGIREKLQSPVKIENRPGTRAQLRPKPFDNPPDLHELLKIFSAQIAIDSEIEVCKTQLVSQTEFSFTEVFDFFDKDGDAYVNSVDIEKTLRQLQIPFHIDEIFLLVKHHTNAAERKMSLSEFQGVVLPLGYVDRGRRGGMTGKVLEELIRVLKVSLRSEIYAEGLRKKVSQFGLVEFCKAFRCLDCDQDGVVSVLDLENSFDRMGVRVRAGDLNRLVKRYSKSYDCEITYSDFLQELTPKIIN